MRELERNIFDDPAVRQRYTVVSQVGSGSFGHVYEAVQRSTGQRVAIKVLRLPKERSGATFAQDVERYRLRSGAA